MYISRANKRGPEIMAGEGGEEGKGNKTWSNKGRDTNQGEEMAVEKKKEGRVL